VALLCGERVFAEALEPDRRASEELLPSVSRCLDRAGVPLSRVDRIAVCAGPGSFTGLRVGLAAVWGLSRARNIPVETVSTLEAMAEASRRGGETAVWSVLDAGRGEVLAQPFDLAGPRARASAGPVRLSRHEAARAIGGSRFVALPADLLGPGGEELPALPAEALARASARDPRPVAAAPLQPIYARASAAEEKLGAS
jgi:N6-L-threonylcarbamoyladenine synthase